jgi:tetratricopeptide (TPR) repeat protein
VPTALLPAQPRPEPGPVREKSNEGALLKDAQRARLSGRYKVAEEHYRKVLSRSPLHAGANVGLHATLMATGRYRNALDQAEKLCRRKPDSALFHMLKGQVLQVTGTYDGAEKAFRKALKQDPKRLRAKIHLGRLLSRLGRKEDARPHLEFFLDLYRSRERLTAEEFVFVGLACIELDRYPAVKEAYSRSFFEYANQMFEQAVEMDPACEEAYLPWGRIFLEKFNHPDAIKTFSELLKRNPRAAEARLGVALATLADLYSGTRRYEKALGSLNEAMAINPNLVAGHELRAELFLVDGQPNRALESLDRALRINPNAFSARALRAAVFRLRGDARAYEEEKKKVLALNPRCGDFFVTVASVLQSKFRYREAARLCEEALRRDPTCWRALTILGLNLMRLGDEERARVILERSHKNDPFNVYTYNMLQLLDVLQKHFTRVETEHFILRFRRREAEVLKPYAEDLLEEGFRRLTKKYGHTPKRKVLVEVFPDHANFSARSIGLPVCPAMGVCFGSVVTLLSPGSGAPFNWGRVLWHEFAHVITLQMTRNRIPRWLTEGISVFEESRGRPEWNREYERSLIEALYHGRLLKIAELDSGFVKPKFRGQVLLSYYQSAMVVEYVVARYGHATLLKLIGGYRDQKPPERIFRDVLGMGFEEFDRAFLAYSRKTLGRYALKPRYDRTDVEKYRELVREHPKNARYWSELARAYLHTGRDVDGEIAAGKALALDGQNADAHLVLAHLAAAAKNTKRAIQMYQKAVALGTTDLFGAHQSLGHLLKRARRPREALAHLLRAAEIFPKSADLWREIALLHKACGEEDRAMKALEKAAALDSKDFLSRRRLVKLYRIRQDRRSLGRVLGEIMYINPFIPEYHRLLASVHRVDRNWPLAEREYRMALRLRDSDEVGVRLGLAEALLELGKLEEAKKLVEHVLLGNPGETRAKDLLRRIEEKMRPPKDAPKEKRAF